MMKLGWPLRSATCTRWTSAPRVGMSDRSGGRTARSGSSPRRSGSRWRGSSAPRAAPSCASRLPRHPTRPSRAGRHSAAPQVACASGCRRTGVRRGRAACARSAASAVRVAQFHRIDRHHSVDVYREPASIAPIRSIVAAAASPASTPATAVATGTPVPGTLAEAFESRADELIDRCDGVEKMRLDSAGAPRSRRTTASLISAGALTTKRNSSAPDSHSARSRRPSAAGRSCGRCRPWRSTGAASRH